MNFRLAVLCKECRFYEEDSWADINDTPMIVAHGICKRWGHGCKTVPEGFCFLGEPQEVVVKGGETNA